MSARRRGGGGEGLYPGAAQTSDWWSSLGGVHTNPGIYLKLYKTPTILALASLRRGRKMVWMNDRVELPVTVELGVVEVRVQRSKNFFVIYASCLSIDRQPKRKSTKSEGGSCSADGCAEKWAGFSAVTSSL